MKISQRTFIIIGITLIGLLILAAFGFWLLPRLLGADEEAIAQIMPDDTAVFVQINLLNLQDNASRQAATAFEEPYSRADIPFDVADPTTIFNGLDANLQSLAGVTVSEDVRPWVGVNIGIGLLSGGTGEQPRWLLAATVRDDAGADAFVDKVNAGGQATAVHHENLVLVAPDMATLDTVLNIPSGLSLRNSRRYQETMTNLTDDRAVSVFVNRQEAETLWSTAVPTDSQGVTQAIQGMLPKYTAVGLAAYATEAGIQVDVVGLHDPLTETQQALLAAQSTVPNTDALLPADTAVYLTGQRPDLLWQLLKGSLDGLGYSSADVDEAIELFSGLFGFDPEADLLAALDGPFAVALVPTKAGTAMPGLSATFLAEHNQPDKLKSQAAALAAGLEQIGFSTVLEGEIYQVNDPNDQPEAAYAVDGDYVVVSTDRAGVTAVIDPTNTLAGVSNYQGVWELLPSDAKPLLFADLTQLISLANSEPAQLPVTQVVLGTNSDQTFSRATAILLLAQKEE